MISSSDTRKPRVKKERGRPIGGCWDDAKVAAIDAWRRDQDDLPTRPEAIRRLVDLGLMVSKAKGRK